jgi:hypothetical protein
MQIVQDEDVIKAGAIINFGGNMGTVHIHPYVGEVTGDLRGSTWVDARQVAAIIRSLMNI